MMTVESNKKWRLAHPERAKAVSRKYYLAHREELKEYRLAHSKKKIAYDKKYYLVHSEKRKARAKEGYLAYPEKVKARTKKWQLENPEKVREIIKRSSAKRRHNFGFIPLNKYFPGSEGHHINYNYIIYIPKKLHRSVWHSLTLGRGMNKINKKAFKFLKEKENKKNGKGHE